MDSDSSKSKPSSITYETTEELLELTDEQVQRLNQVGEIHPLENLKQKLKDAEERSSKLISSATSYIGVGYFVSFSMNVSCCQIPERFCTCLLGGSSGYDAEITFEKFCNEKPAKLYNFDDCLKLFCKQGRIRKLEFEL
ncbi:unnamed protein product [Rotaria sordida]|uniref:Uncharacterized protein n=1 Tax=Rotaria sordida TaxID=392033 RepID=A0A814ZN99_9BILA|nr:unnamed protein product [Rotaria sordida]CAF1526270.1 unnamed protein product [Rotaria sordida]